jgi:mannose-6-phosphate isomerase-like protein (cupin superfamily)
MTSMVVVALAMAVSLVMAERPVAGQTVSSRPGTLALTVVDSTGKPLDDVAVTVSGNVDRSGTTGADGTLSFQLPAGTYRVRMRSDKYLTLEKEVTIRAAAKLTAEGMLNAAPPPSAPPPPSPTPTPEPKQVPSSTLKPGVAVITSVPDLFAQMEKSLRTTPTVERELGCSGASSSRVIMTRENITLHTHADADEMLYVVAGEASMTIADNDQAVEAGWFGVVPRGASHSVMRRGRNVLVVLSVRSGPPCPGL